MTASIKRGNWRDAATIIIACKDKTGQSEYDYKVSIFMNAKCQGLTHCLSFLLSTDTDIQKDRKDEFPTEQYLLPGRCN